MSKNLVPALKKTLAFFNFGNWWSSAVANRQTCLNWSFLFLKKPGHTPVFYKKMGSQGRQTHLAKDKLKYKSLQKGGGPATPSGTATLLRLSPSHQVYPRRLL